MQHLHYATLALSVLPLRIEDLFKKKKLFIFDNENKMSRVINAIQYDFKRYPKFNKNKLHNRSVESKTFLQV